MQGAMMHCGAEPITWPQVKLLEPPPPTDTHFPIPHREIFSIAMEKIQRAGYEIEHIEHYTNQAHAHYFGLMELKHDEQDYATMVALRNSYDKVFRASLAIGARVFVCDNLSFSGDIVVGHKNTVNGFKHLPERFDEAVSNIRFMQKKQELRFAEYKLAPIDDRTADHLTMECWRRGIVNLQRIGQINNEWYKPANDHGDKTAWRFFNAATASMKSKSVNQLIRLPKHTIDLHLLLDEFIDLELPTEDQTDESDDSFMAKYFPKVFN